MSADASVELSFDGAEGSMTAALPSVAAKGGDGVADAENTYQAHMDDDEEESIPEESAASENEAAAAVAASPPRATQPASSSSAPKDVAVETEEHGSNSANFCTLFKNLYSMCLLIFSVAIVMSLIFSRQTKLSNDVHPGLAFVVIWAMLIWLNMVEGGQASLVGLAPVNFDLYKDTHRKSYMSTATCHRGDNLDRYLMGRQFMVIFIVFIINLSGAPLPGSTVWGNQILTNIFLGSGLAMILMATMIGQLNSQVNASHCMLDYINNYFAVFTYRVARLVEVSGLMHSSYLIAIIVGMLAGKPVESNEPPRSGIILIFFWTRVLLSLAVLGFALAVTLEALFNGQTTIWQGLPPAVGVILFFVLMSVVGLLEGMQIAFFAVAKVPKSERGKAKFAMMTCDVLFRNRGHNLAGFMIGRQITVTLCFFVIARVTTLAVEVGVDENIFGVSDGVQNFFNTGLLGAVITTILGSISWQLVASAFPIAFLSNPIVYIFLRLALLLEATGICSGAWVLAAIHKKIAGFQRDEVYIGTAEERAARNMADHEEELHLQPGHPRKLPGFADANIPKSLEKLMSNDPSVREFVRTMSQKLDSANSGNDLQFVDEEKQIS